MKSIRLLIVILLSFLPLEIKSATIDATIQLQVCGNNLREGLEECDTSDLAGRTCQSFGFISGSLACRASCEFNTSVCTNGSTGGGGGSSVIQSKATSVIFSGRAYPNAKINILKDAIFAISLYAGADGNFRHELSGLTAGTYAFSFTAFDNSGRQSLLANLPVSLLSGRATEASGIFLPPTAGLDKKELLSGDVLSVSGQAYPGSAVIASIGVGELKKTIAGEDGKYQLIIDTAGMKAGQYGLKVRAEIGGAVGYGQQSDFKIVATREEIGAQDGGILSAPMGDINNDAKINLLDFSILAFWYDRPDAPAAIDFNSDGKVNLKDFSILAYYWTG